MDEEEVVLCNHCKKEVAKANYDLHKPHCERFLCTCPDCDETVPRDQLEEHKTEQHTEVKCKMCNKKMERRLLLDHEKDECTERPEICEFCQLEQPLSNLKEHQVACGSRTERCSDCGQYVKLMDQLDHPQICSTSTPTSSKNLVVEDDNSETEDETMLQCQNCLKYISSDNLKEHKVFCKPFLKNTDNEDDDSEDEDENPNPGNDNTPDSADLSFLSFKKTKKDNYIDMDLDKISTCPVCHLALPVKTLEWHEVLDF
ncbi:XIAP-associated factor 1 [Labeo rohita]|uniref:XIAP-associated factor 1 n=1 Tax=Labeo rohita TaxID=84645 RepID=A0ABQ8M0A9_LABRO|nr:XIAP-associated factor 1 [Labeo rohita]